VRKGEKHGYAALISVIDREFGNFTAALSTFDREGMGQTDKEESKS
jgi:hypothetical protein